MRMRPIRTGHPPPNPEPALSATGAGHVRPI